jgi:hypothetical protein
MKIRPDTELAWARPIARPEILRPQQPKASPPATAAQSSRPEAQSAHGAAPAQSARIVPRGSFVNIRV